MIRYNSGSQIFRHETKVLCSIGIFKIVLNNLFINFWTFWREFYSYLSFLTNQFAKSFLLQFAEFVSDQTSTHGSHWYSSLSSHPKIQTFFFLFFFGIQISLFAIFVRQIFFIQTVEIRTSVEFVQMKDIPFPGITICSSSFFNKEALKGNFITIGQQH